MQKQIMTDEGLLHIWNCPFVTAVGTYLDELDGTAITRLMTGVVAKYLANVTKPAAEMLCSTYK